MSAVRAHWLLYPSLLSNPPYCPHHLTVYPTLLFIPPCITFYLTAHPNVHFTGSLIFTLLYTPLCCTFHLTLHLELLSTPFYRSPYFTVHFTLLYTLPYCSPALYRLNLLSAPFNCPLHLTGSLISWPLQLTSHPTLLSTSSPHLTVHPTLLVTWLLSTPPYTLHLTLLFTNPSCPPHLTVYLSLLPTMSSPYCSPNLAFHLSQLGKQLYVTNFCLFISLLLKISPTDVFSYHLIYRQQRLVKWRNTCTQIGYRGCREEFFDGNFLPFIRCQLQVYSFSYWSKAGNINYQMTLFQSVNVV